MKNTIIQLLLKELVAEAATTRKFLSTVPDDKLEWQPHPKSMSIQAVATHVAEIPGWISLAIKTEGIDFAAQPYVPTRIQSNKDLLLIFEKAVAQATTDMEETNDSFILEGNWVMRSGDVIHASLTKYETIRHSMAQMIHHRAQLGVNLRLLNIPIPGSYGPSADDQNF